MFYIVSHRILFSHSSFRPTLVRCSYNDGKCATRAAAYPIRKLRSSSLTPSPRQPFRPDSRRRVRRLFFGALVRGSKSRRSAAVSGTPKLPTKQRARLGRLAARQSQPGTRDAQTSSTERTCRSSTPPGTSRSIRRWYLYLTACKIFSTISNITPRVLISYSLVLLAYVFIFLGSDYNKVTIPIPYYTYLQRRIGISKILGYGT